MNESGAMTTEGVMESIKSCGEQLRNWNKFEF